MNRPVIGLIAACLLLGPLGLAQDAEKRKPAESEAAAADPTEAAVAKIRGFRIAPTPRPAFPEFPTPTPGPIDRKALEAPKPAPAAEGPITEGTIDGHPFRVFWNGVDATMLVLKPWDGKGGGVEAEGSILGVGGKVLPAEATRGQGGDVLGMLVAHYFTRADGLVDVAHEEQAIHAVMPDGKSVLFNRLRKTSQNRIAAQWKELRDMRTGRVLHRFSADESRTATIVSPDGRLMAGETRKGDASHLSVWSLKEGRRERSLGQCTGRHRYIPAAFSPDGKLIVAHIVAGGSRDKREAVVMHDVASGRIVWQKRAPTRYVTYGAGPFAPDGQWLAVEVSDFKAPPGSDHILLVNPRTGETVRTIRTGMLWIQRIGVSPDGGFLAYAGGLFIGLTEMRVRKTRAELHVIDTSSWRRVKTIQRERDAYGIYFTHGSDVVVYRDRGGFVRAVRLKKAPTPTRPQAAAEEPVAEPPADLGDLFAETDDWEDAEEAYAMAAEASPDDPSHRQRLAMAQFQQGKFAEAAEAASKAVALRPDDPTLQNLYAAARAKQKRWPDAEKALRTAVRLQPKNAVYQANLANVLLYQDKVDDAVAAATEARRLGKGLEHPVYPKVAQRVGEEAARSLREGRADAAATAFRSAAGFDPKNAAYGAGLGEALLAAGSRDEAIKALGEAVKLASDNPAYQATLGKACAAAGKHAEAAAAYAEAAWLEPTRRAHHYKLGNALFALKRHDEAEAAFRKAVELAPTNAFSHHWLGNALYEQERYEEAEEHFRKAVELKPDDAGNQGWLAECLTKLGKHADAVTPLREWARLAPGHADARNRLGLALFRLKEYAEAEAAFREAARLKPDKALYHANLAHALVRQGKREEALPCARKALELGGTAHPVYKEMGLTPERSAPDGGAGPEGGDPVRKGPSAPNAGVRGPTGPPGPRPPLKERLAELARRAKLLSAEAKAAQRRGLQFMGQKKWAEAVLAFQEAVRREPDWPTYRANLGDALCGAGRLVEAVDAYQGFVRLEPHYGTGCRDLAGTLFRLGRYAEAEAAFRRALELMPFAARVHYDLGHAILRQGRVEEARQVVEEARKKHVLDHPVVAELARAEAGKPRAAPRPPEQKPTGRIRDESVMGVSMDPGDRLVPPTKVRAVAKRAAELRKQKKWVEAVIAYQEAVRLAPKYSLYRNELACAYCDGKQYGPAEAAFREAVRLRPNRGIYHANLAWALLKLGRRDEATQEAHKAMELGEKQHPVFSKLDIKSPVATSPPPTASREEGIGPGESRKPPGSSDDLPDAVTQDLIIE